MYVEISELHRIHRITSDMISVVCGRLQFQDVSNVEREMKQYDPQDDTYTFTAALASLRIVVRSVFLAYEKLFIFVGDEH